jgi:AcrR family transcriptional regulator
MSGSEQGRPGGADSMNGRTKRSTNTAIVPMYARLPKGPHNLGVTGVVRNQRNRMHGGMIEAVARVGYRHATVRLVVGLAGVSRRVFYEQFSGKQECFTATLDVIVKRIYHRLAAAYTAAPGSPERRLRAALTAFGGELNKNPKALHLLLIDAQTVDPEGRRLLQTMTALCESRMATVFSARERPDALPLPAVRAIVGGLRRVVSTRLRNGKTARVGTLMKELTQWALLYKSPATSALRPRVCANLPFPEAPELERGACGGDEIRARLLRSAIELRLREEKADEVINSLRIADGAKLPIEVFTELFRGGPELCYLEALDVLGDELLRLIAEDDGLVSTEWPDAACRTVARMLAYLAASPARLITLAGKALEAGPAASANIGDLALEVATLLTEGAPEPPVVRVAVEAIAGGLWQILVGEVAAGRGHRLPALTEYVSYVILTPFVGAEAAVAAIVRSRVGVAPAATNGSSPAAANGSGSHPATNGSAPVPGDYRRLADLRSAKYVNTTPTSTESTITTISGARPEPAIQ